MKTWQEVLIFFLAIVAIFFAVGGHSDPILAIIYFVIVVVGCLVILITGLARKEFVGNLKNIVFCSRCKKCLPLIPQNKAPRYDGEDEIPADDYADFKKEHEGHQLREAPIIFGPLKRKNKQPNRNEIFLAKEKKGGFCFVRVSKNNVYHDARYERVPVFDLNMAAFVLWKWLLNKFE
jgi:hypothetical protein